MTNAQAMTPKIKSKACRVCGAPYMPRTSLQTVCGSYCAIQHARRTRDAADKRKEAVGRKELKVAKDKIQPLKHWADKAQVAVNAYVRARDGKICISCGTQNPNIQYAAGHYRTRKAASQLRYNEDNLHSQCNHQCNQMLSGNIPAYREALIAKIGQDRHDALVNNCEVKRWTKEECQQIEKIFKAKVKALHKAQGSLFSPAFPEVTIEQRGLI